MDNTIQQSARSGPASPDERASRGGPKDVFLNLLVTVTLYASVIGLLTLLFQYINIGFPDQLEGNYWSYSSIYDKIRWATSVLFVMFGTYVFLSRSMEKSYFANPSLRELRSRRWLVHLTVFASALTLIIALITLIYRFLNGDLSARFGLKVLAVLVVAGATFAYYLWDSKRGIEASKRPRVWAYVSAVVVVATIIAGFFVAGSPAEQRKRRFDERRVNDLSMIQSEVTSYWQRKRALPQQLSDLNNDTMGFRAPLDPESGVQYEYLVIEPLKFKLCAEFAADSMPERSGRVKYSYSAYGPYEQNWEHGTGKVCFDRPIDPSLYPTPEEPMLK